jgi:lactoylglutathione lyase
MRIDHIALFCRDIEAMKNFFVKYFDAMPGNDHLSKRTGETNCFLAFTDGGSRLELITFHNTPMDLPNSFAHISISVGSKEKVDLITKQLDNDGYQLLSGPRTTGDGYYESCIVGLENIKIEITE